MNAPNIELRDKLRCMMVHAAGQSLLNQEWGVDCDIDELDNTARTAGNYLWMLNAVADDSDCEITIITLGDIGKFVNRTSETLHQCESTVCEEKMVTIDCSSLQVTDTDQTLGCDLIIDDITV